MTGGEIDTAAMRALVADTWPLTPKEIYALCDALDRARTEIQRMLAACEEDRLARITEGEKFTGIAAGIVTSAEADMVLLRARAERAEAELAASEKWRHDTALERDFADERRRAAEAERDALKAAVERVRALCEDEQTAEQPSRVSQVPLGGAGA